MTDEHRIQIAKPDTIFWISKYELALVHGRAVSLLDFRTSLTQQICESEDVYNVEKSGDRFLISGRNRFTVVRKNQIEFTLIHFAQNCTISGKYILFLGGGYIELYDCEIHDMVDVFTTGTIGGRFCVQNGQIVWFGQNGVRVFSIDGSKIHCSCTELGEFIVVDAFDRGFYIKNGKLVVCSEGKIQSHPIRKIVGGPLPNRIKTKNIDIKLCGSKYTVFDKSRALNWNLINVLGGFALGHMTYGKTKLKLDTFSDSNDMLAYYSGDLCLLNYKCDLFSMFWKYEKPELLKLRFEVAMQLRRILPCPIVKLIIIECK